MLGRGIYRSVLIGLLCLVVLPLSFLNAQEEGGGLIEELKLFSKALGAIHEAYPGNLQPRAVLYQAVKGMLASLDRYSEFIEPERYQLIQIAMKGEYAGIGAILKPVGTRVAIRAVEPGKPAERAGLLAEDIILKINGVIIENRTIADVAGMLRGDENTPVLLQVMRGPAGEIFDIKVQRQKIEIEATQEVRRVGRAIGYFRIVAWQENTTSQVEMVLQDLKRKGMEALIMDLRDNDGGLMTQAVALAELFLPKDKKIVSVQSKIAEQRKEYFSSKDGGYKALPLVVLVNEKTASASEVFSGALQDHQRATIVGVKTFGKGSVQSVIPLDDVSGMKLTTARYVTPEGRILDGVGLVPDQTVENKADGTEGGDPQMAAAISVLKKFN